MATPPPSPGTGNKTRGNSRSFVIAGVCAIALTSLVVPLGFLDWWPFVGELLRDRGAVGTIAALVITVTFWIVFFVSARFLLGSQERSALAMVRGRLQHHATGTPEAIGRHMSSPLRDTPAQHSAIGQRLATLSESGGADAGQTVGSLSSRSELDHARSDVSYGPARALVWALPALGFLGTAAEMSRAVDGLSESVGSTGGYAGLRDALVKDVIPPLADAFGATLFALGASVVCHLLLTWTNVREEQILLEVEEIMLQVLNRVALPQPSLSAPAPAVPAELSTALAELVQELTMVRSAMTDAANRVSALDLNQLSHLREIGHLAELSRLAPLLQSAHQTLEQIHAEMGQDLIVRRLPPPSPRS